MKRKLLSYEAFNQIESTSLTHAAYELSEAEGLVSQLLETAPVKLHCFNQSRVVYEMADGTYLRADYVIKENKVNLTNIEQIVIDEDSLNNSMKSCLKELVEALANENVATANTKFKKYMEMASPKMKFSAGRRDKSCCDKMASNAKGNMKEGFDPDVLETDKKDEKKSKAARFGHSKNPGARKKAALTRKHHKSKIDSTHDNPSWKSAKDQVKKLKKAGKKARIKPQRFDDWTKVAHNVLDYVDYMELAPAISEALVGRDKSGDVTALQIPSTQVRAEGKVLDYKYKGLKSDVKVLREQALLLSTSPDFQKSVADVKRHNNLSDNDGLEESLNTLVARFPMVLYLTQGELAKVVAEALNNIGVANFDDQTCAFMAEGILRVAFGAYPDRANRIVHLSGNKLSEGDFDTFQNIGKTFYPQVDEAFQLEMRVFEDLRDVMVDVHDAALEAGSKDLCEEVARYVEKIDEVISGKAKPNLSLAEQAAAFLTILVETNLESGSWEVVKQPYTTLVGEHPDMAKKATHSYAPSKDFTGDWGDVAPALDDEGGKYGGAGAKKMRSHSWGNVGGKDTYPSLDNPVAPKPGDFTMKGEKGVDKSTDDGLAQWQSGDTVPGLDNPYVPKSIKPHVNNDNRVDDVDAKL